MEATMRHRRHRELLQLPRLRGSLRRALTAGLLLQLFACAEIPELKGDLENAGLVPCDTDAVYCSNDEVTGCIAGALMTLRSCVSEGLRCQEGPSGATCGAGEVASVEVPEAEPLEGEEDGLSSCGIPENGRCVGSFLLRCDNDVLSEQFPPIASMLSPLHFRFFCDKFVQVFIPRFISAIYNQNQAIDHEVHRVGKIAFVEKRLTRFKGDILGGLAD